MVKITFHAERIAPPDASPTIYDALKARLGREPTHQELCDDCKRIIREAREARA
jgi:hypothetical protein